ncbi:MAG: hypothetical protein JW849_02735 [Phycisphaerae bacterium]|nr:hypothetical protein [Phycisphaerae bacterium]
MAKGLRAFLQRLNPPKPESTLPPHVPLVLHDGRSVDVPTSPLDGNSPAFRAYKIVSDLPDQLSVRPTMLNKLFFILFILPGIIVLFLMVPSVLRTPGKEFMDYIGIGLAVLLCTTFVVLGLAGLMGWIGLPSAVLDRRIGLYWRGRPPRAIRAWVQPPLPLEAIAAVQICSKRVSSQNGSYTAYQINLVLSEPPGERIYFLSHGNKKAILHDAQQVADFLSRPVLEHV